MLLHGFGCFILHEATMKGKGLVKNAMSRLRLLLLSIRLLIHEGLLVVTGCSKRTEIAIEAIILSKIRSHPVRRLELLLLWESRLTRLELKIVH